MKGSSFHFLRQEIGHTEVMLSFKRRLDQFTPKIAWCMLKLYEVRTFIFAGVRRAVVLCQPQVVCCVKIFAERLCCHSLHDKITDGKVGLLARAITFSLGGVYEHSSTIKVCPNTEIHVVHSLQPLACVFTAHRRTMPVFRGTPAPVPLKEMVSPLRV